MIDDCTAAGVRMAVVTTTSRAPTSRRRWLDAVAALAVAAAGEDRLALSVSDTGSGFSPSALAHLFEPFFTTKQPGEGLGLGLTISRDILRDFGGDLLAEAAPGGGARFVVLLPRPPHPQPEKGTP